MREYMTPRERLLTTLRGDKADRAPVSPFVQDEYLAYYYPDKTVVDRVIDAKNLADELDFDLIAKPRTFELPYFLSKSFPGWEVRKTQLKEGENILDTLEIVTPDGTLRQEAIGPDAGIASSGIHKAVRKRLLDTKENREIFFRHLPPFSSAVEQEMKQTATQWRAVMGERGVLAPWGGGTYNLACELCGIETLFTAPYEDEECYADFMGQLVQAVLPAVRALAGTEVECVGIQGNMANSAVMSADFFDCFVRPYEQPIIDAVHAEGAFTVYHNCGYAKRFYPLYQKMKMTVWETVSSPPQGDNDLAEAKSAVGSDICLLGNLDQIELLKSASPEEVADHTRNIVSTGSPGGRYIFSTSDFLEKGTPIENVQAMIQAAREAG
ncbi:MAG: hypothetical protein GY794_18635 [bacterium]|nr:hypothetical protein [bacterium]